VFAATWVVVTENVAEVAPPATRTVAGTVAGEPLLSAMSIPVEGAGPLRVTVPVEEEPPTTAVGLNVSPVMTGALIATSAVFETVPRVAVIVAVVLEATADVVMLKFTERAPARTVTDASTEAPLVLESETEVPPVGAGPSRVTVPVAEVPPVTLVGAIVTVVICGGLTVRTAVFATPRLAVTVDVAVAVTTEVEMVKVAEVWPPATVTGDETVATAVLLLVRLTVIPPVGAGPSSVTVPVDGFPPARDAGLSVSEETDGALTLRVAVFEPPRVAEMTGDAVVPTAEVESVKVAVVAPAGTVTDAGTVAALGMLLLRATAIPPVGAGPLSVTVPVEPVPPITVVGASTRFDATGALTVRVTVLLLPE
jgi:hypothetical protein